MRSASTQYFSLSERHYGSNTEVPLHAHTKDYIIITLDGTYFSTFGTRTEEYKPWTVTYHQARVSHTSRYAVRGAKVLYVELPMERLKGVWQMPASHLAHLSLQGGVVDWTARQLYNEFNAFDTFSSVVIDGYVMQLLGHLLRHCAARPHRLPTWLGNVDEMIRSRFMEPLALDGIAKSVLVHPGHLAREYRRYYRCTIGEQIRRLRIEYACEQLSATDRCLSEIALAAGFSDQSHFTVSFKQHIGTAPSQYRKATKIMLIPQKNVSQSQDARD
jgi:AraC family transcriptional regulator